MEVFDCIQDLLNELTGVFLRVEALLYDAIKEFPTRHPVRGGKDPLIWRKSAPVWLGNGVKYLRVLFISGGKLDCETDWCIGSVSTEMWMLHGTVEVKRELSWKAKPSIYHSVCVTNLTSGHELWVLTERERSQTQVAWKEFPPKAALEITLGGGTTRRGSEYSCCFFVVKGVRWGGLFLSKDTSGNLPLDVSNCEEALK